MLTARTRVPTPRNEPVLNYAPGSPERATLQAELQRQSKLTVEIAPVIGGASLSTGRVEELRSPHRHDLVLARVHQAGADEAQRAIEAALAARRAWSAMPFEDRAAVFLRAAEILAGRRRAEMNAATMLGQSKTCFQAEIDSACELIDFWRWNVSFAEQIHEQQPYSPPGQWNQLDVRPLEGFVFAVTPFNFTAIGGNLPTAPALLGNVVVWKPAGTQVLSAQVTLDILREAGLPDGVINFVPGDAPAIAERCLAHPELAGVHFTGSTAIFQKLWKTVGDHLPHYRTYPRLVGETGGKDFICVHPSADADAVATAIVRGGFEYQGQKCSAASRIYVPDDLWPRIREATLGQLAEVRMGDVADFRNFVGAVIDRKAFSNISGYIGLCTGDKSVTVLAGGMPARPEETGGWFVSPTLVQVQDPKHRLMSEEIFGPVVTVHVYPAARWTEMLRVCDQTSPYGLTGAVFARDRAAVAEARTELRQAAGNFYINDKPTGAVVGQQPFGGARASGTNDKAGSLWNLVRWVSPRAIKETLDPPRHFAYPFLRES
jgi:1-pyrroline-5-carboxylate dehydrogenase